MTALSRNFAGTYFLLLVLFLVVSFASAFPNGAGDCPERRPAVGGNHVSPRATIATGSLELNEFQLNINGRALRTGNSLILQSGMEHHWKLSGVAFRGFLIRLGGNADTTVALSSGNRNVQEAFAACVLAQGVGGVTHTDNSEKMAVSGVIRLDEEARDLPLDVTVVVENRDSVSTYFYSGYTLEFQETVATLAPTDNPTTGAPTRNPTQSPTLPQTTLSPTNSPSSGTTTSSPTTSFPTVQSTQTENPTTTTKETIVTDAPTLTSFTDPPLIQSEQQQPPAGATTQQPTSSSSFIRTGSPTATTTTWPTWPDYIDDITLSPTTMTLSSPQNTKPSLRPTTTTEAPKEYGSFDDITILVSLVDVPGGCSFDWPCQECQGDCNSHHDCVGDLECYRRPGEYGTPIPGCQGMGTPGYDYCYQPSALTMRLRTPPCSVTEPCEVCEGDCNDDADCRGNLKCFHRAHKEESLVPGCTNLGIEAIPIRMRRQWNGLDYCYDENLVDSADDDAGDTSMDDSDKCQTDSDCIPGRACLEEPCNTNSYVCRNSNCVYLERCGSTVCDLGEYCCNESCSLCVPVGSYCFQTECEPCGDDTMCRPGEVCCGPECGICQPQPQPGETCPDECHLEQCGSSVCKSNEFCCNESCSLCAPKGALGCSQEPCEPCGDTTCNPGEVCCGQDCGVCQPLPGETCPDECLKEKCGNTVCDVDEFCCNESCSLCAPKEGNGECPKETCAPCGNTTCSIGEVCCGIDCGICQPQPGGSCPEECQGEDGTVGGAGEGGLEAQGIEDGTIVVDLVFCESDADCIAPACEREDAPCLSFVCQASRCVFVVTCGDELCNVGEGCCSPDCGVCRPPGEPCPESCNSLSDDGGNNVIDITFCETDENCSVPECTEEPCVSKLCIDSQCVLVENCGTTICGPDEYCCNEGCSLCAPIGESCNQDACPACGDAICNQGDICCKPDCGICMPRSGPCPGTCNPDTNDNGANTTSCENDKDCTAPACSEKPCQSYVCRDSQCMPVEQCGTKECGPDEYCCNESCSLCVATGESCAKSFICMQCGDEVCNLGETCCNPRCGICRPPGGSCPAVCNDYWNLPDVDDYWALPDADPMSGDEQPVDDTPRPPNNEENEAKSCQSDEECANSLQCTTEPCPVSACRDSQCTFVQPCGETECNQLEYCCNESCSICVALESDEGCTDEVCQQRGTIGEFELEEQSELVECEVTTDCPTYLCFDTTCPMIECRDNKCLLYTPCGENRCGEDEVCCCGTCSPESTICDEDACAVCGKTFCPPGLVCCNESCSICTQPGGFCTAEICLDEDEDV